MVHNPLDSGGSGGTDDDGSTSISGENLLVLKSLGIGWLADIGGVLRAFGNSPAGFILGVASSMVLGGIETIVTTLLDGVLILFVGSEPGLEGTLGLADIPLFVGTQLTAVGSWIGTGSATTPGVLDAANAMTTALINLTSSFGPLAPIMLALIVSGMGIAAAWLARKLLEIAADVVPGGGALLQ